VTTVYLSAAKGSDDFDGLDPKKPVATFDRATELAVAARADVIEIAPGRYNGLSSVPSDCELRKGEGSA
jgi:hypothetical protein